jgi:putative oxidoreductase
MKDDDPAEGSIDNVNVPRGDARPLARQEWLRRRRDRLVPPLLSVLRAVTGFLFMAHGTQKLFAFPVAQPRDPAEILSLMGAAGLMEFIGGGLLLVGLFTRPVAFLLSGEMATAYFLRHAPRGFWPALNDGELAALYCFLFLFFAAAGPGAWSLDAARRSWRLRHRPEAAARPFATSH